MCPNLNSLFFLKTCFPSHSSLLINHTAIYPVIHARDLVWQYEIVWLQNGKTTGFCKRKCITCLRIISWKAFVRMIISSQRVSFLKLCISHLSFFFLFLLSSVSSLCELDFSDNIWLTKTPVLLPGKSHGQRSLVGCSPWALEELDTTEQLHFHFSFSCIGEGNGNSSVLAQRIPGTGEPSGLPSTGVAQSRTWLKRLNRSSSSSSMTFQAKPTSAFLWCCCSYQKRLRLPQPKLTQMVQICHAYVLCLNWSCR